MASRLSLAAKLYSVFALFALLTAAITALSDYNARRSVALTHEIETVNLAALNVERVNSLVYAVVMESRGVYMSTEPAVVTSSCSVFENAVATSIMFSGVGFSRMFSHRALRTTKS
jgi:hypothetical protein